MTIGLTVFVLSLVALTLFALSRLFISTADAVADNCSCNCWLAAAVSPSNTAVVYTLTEALVTFTEELSRENLSVEDTPKETYLQTCMVLKQTDS